METGDARNADLLRQIAAYAGAINRHQNRAGGGRHAPPASRHRSWTPYGTAPSAQPQGVGKKRKLQSSRHKTLVLGKRKPDASASDATASSGDGSKRDDATQSAPHSAAWISSRDRGHMTLTNASVYDASVANKLAAMAETRARRRAEKLRLREAREADRLRRLAQTTLVHGGITYRFNNRYNLLIRQDDDNTQGLPTPRETTIHGVLFLKSPKTNNLFRKTAVKLRAKGRNKTLRARPCRYYCRTGSCKKRDAGACPYQHDPAVRAVCPAWLNDACDLADDECPLVHRGGSLHNLPDCVYHLRMQHGALPTDVALADAVGCTRQDCRYSHARDVAQLEDGVCPEFAKVGYCPRGGGCRKRHVRESRTRTKPSGHGGISDDSRLDTSDVATSEHDAAEDTDYSTDSFEEEDFDENAFDADYVEL